MFPVGPVLWSMNNSSQAELLYTFCTARPVTPHDYTHADKDDVGFFCCFSSLFILGRSPSVGLCAGIRDACAAVCRVDVSPRPGLCAERFRAVAEDSLAVSGV